MKNNDLRAVILAAGKGVRMNSDRAKVLHEILGAPMVHYVVQAVRDAGLSSIYVVTGHQAEQVQKAIQGDGIQCVHQAEQKGTGHALMCCESAFKGYAGAILLVSGDTPLLTAQTLKDLIQTHTRAGAACTFLTACVEDPTGYGRVVRDPATGRVAKIVEELDADTKERQTHEVNAACYVFDAAAAFAALKEVRPDNKKGEYYLTDVVGILLRQGKKVETHRINSHTEIFGVNTRKDLVAVSNLLRWKTLDHLMTSGVCVVDPSTTYIEPDVTIGQDTVIHPFTVLRRGVTIGSHCEVGPFTHLRPGTVLEDHAEIGNFVEVKKSRIGTHSKAKHLTYLGDATIGREVNIGAGTITANYDGKQKHPTVIEDFASTGSGTVLVAPVKMRKNSRTGAGAIVTSGHDVMENDTVVGVPARSLRKK